MTVARQGIVVRHPRLNHVDLAGLLVKLVPATEKAWYLVSSIADTAFGNFDRSAAEELVAGWSQGRVFCPTCEIRWRRAGGDGYNDVLVLCENAALKPEGFHPIGDIWQVTPPGERAALMAWGSPVPEAPELRAESRLPRRLRYPAECRDGRLIFLYYCAPSGEGQFLRLTGVR
jgi:hypothetical protein